MAITFDLASLGLSPGNYEVYATVSALGYAESDKSNAVTYVVEPQEEEPKEITFNIGNATYTALSGMTWAEWVDSEYNTNGYYIDIDNTVSTADGAYSIGDYVDSDQTVDFELSHYEIVADYDYNLV